MKKISLLVLALQLAAFSLMAQDAQPVQKLNVWQLDGSRIQFLLTDEPVTTFADGNLLSAGEHGQIYPRRSARRHRRTDGSAG